ncbi:MAG: hypothetical protein AABY22_16870 [Nanoarchaeota archaeon]
MVKLYHRILKSILERGGTASTTEIRDDTLSDHRTIWEVCKIMCARNTLKKTKKMIRISKKGGYGVLVYRKINIYSIYPNKIEGVIANLKENKLILQ